MKASPLDGVRHPKIYGFTTPDYKTTAWKGPRQGKGLIKVGYTDRDVDTRIRESLNGIQMPEQARFELLLAEAALTDDGHSFQDHSVHKQLKLAGVERVNGEWFECTKDEVLAAIKAVRKNEALGSVKAKQNFPMRPEQEEAVNVTAKYLKNNASPQNPPHFLWNAKMRFGKTFTAYQLAKKMGWTRVLVLTYKPAAERAWREDLERHEDFNDWRFKSNSTDIEGVQVDLDDPAPLVWFASFQDVLGTDNSGDPKLKNEPLYLIDWDCVIIDEFHFGAWRDAARGLYIAQGHDGSGGDSSEKKAVESPDLDSDFADSLQGSLKQDLDIANFLYLSGTPFRALTEGEFLEDQVFNWTYSDEQRAKTGWSESTPNPYIALPKMHLLVYEMPEKLREAALNNQSEFSLTEFFKTQKDADGNLSFIHASDVQKWLDLLRGQDLTEMWASISTQHRPPLPFEDSNLLRSLQHTLWYLPGVDACTAMKEMLTAPHNKFFHDYEIIVAAGTSAGRGEKALPPVEKAIGQVPQDAKTITLSCGKLMTGVTVPAWAGIFMLRELQSPESYFQAAFRVQSPWSTTQIDTEKGGEEVVVFKDNCYVLDFSPNRALRQIVDYATRLSADVAGERDNKAAIEEFMEFLPVLSFDGYSMARLEAADVLNFLQSGVSSSMLARRWNSPELLSLDLAAMEALLGNAKLLESLEQIEMFRNITDDLTAMISTTKELTKKKLAKETLTGEEKKKDKEATKRRDDLKKRLQRFLTRIPAFMYLTDLREETVKDVITKLEPALFQKVTGLSIGDFEQLLAAGVFNDHKMDDAVWKFRTFEEPSLEYASAHKAADVVGGWSVGRNEQLAALIDAELLPVGTKMRPSDAALAGVVGIVSDNYGIVIDGIRYASPHEAAEAAATGDVGDGWEFWTVDDGTQTPVTLAALASSLSIIATN